MRPIPGCQMRTVESPPAEASVAGRPPACAGRKASACTGPRWLFRDRTDLHGPGSQTRIVASAPPEQNPSPSGEAASASTGPECPSSAATSRRVAASQTRTTRSAPAVASPFPPSSQITSWTMSACPSSRPTRSPEGQARSSTAPDSAGLPPATARVEPSGEKARART